MTSYPCCPNCGEPAERIGQRICEECGFDADENPMPYGDLDPVGIEARRAELSIVDPADFGPVTTTDRPF